MSKEKEPMAFGRDNYRWLFISMAVLILGFSLMALDNETFGFGTLGLTLGPIVVLIGFGLVFFSILLKPSAKSKE